METAFVHADHDVAQGIEQANPDTTFTIDSEFDSFTADRKITTFSRGCPATFNTHSGQIDGGMIYGTIPEFLANTLRVPGKCELRVSVDSTGAPFPPLSTVADASGRFVFLAGDFRIGEHTFLFVHHTVRPRHIC